jgi:hypothetical protein
MSPGWELTLGIVGGVASIAVILDYFGIKPNALAWESIMALSQKWKLAIMLGLVCLTLSFSGYGFYRSLRPHVIEKIVEKPVDRVVEKERIVQAECPKTDTKGTAKAKANKDSPPVTPPQQPPIKQDCGAGNCAASVGQQGGVTAGQINIDTDRRLTPKQLADIGADKIDCAAAPFIKVTASSDEAKRYASQFIGALRKAGCRADLELPIPGLRPDITGVFIGVRDMDKIDPSATALGKVLSSANIPFLFRLMEPDFFPGAAFVLVIGAKESPSAVSYEQHGGITAGVVNLGPPQPKLTWTQESGRLSANGKPTVIVKLTVDRALDEPAFLATCSRPCKAVDGGIPIGFSQAQAIGKSDNPLMAGLALRTPPVLGAGIVFSITLESQDKEALTIRDVSRVPMSQVPKVDAP